MRAGHPPRRRLHAVLALVLGVQAASTAVDSTPPLDVNVDLCDQLSSAAGPVTGPPEVAPALVAPVVAIVNYPALAFLEGPAWNTGSSIAFQPPVNYTGGFTLTDNSTLTEEYRLLRFEVRKVWQGSEYPLEFALVHRQENPVQGTVPRYAVVTVPLDSVAGSPMPDVLGPLSSGLDLPSSRGKRTNLVPDSKTPFRPARFFENDRKFLHSWGPAGGVCGADISAMRRLASRLPQPVLPDEFAKFLSVLGAGTPSYTQQRPPYAWLVRSCPVGVACPTLNATETDATLTDMEAQMSSAQTTFQAKTTALNEALANLKAQRGTPQNYALYDLAQKTLEDVKVAQATVKGLQHNVNKLNATLLEKLKGWDADAPALANVSTAAVTTAAPSAATPLPTTAAPTVAPAVGTTASSVPLTTPSASTAPPA